MTLGLHDPKNYIIVVTIICDFFSTGTLQRGRPRKQYIDNFKQWTQLTTSQCVRAAEGRSRWKELVSQAMVANDHT